MTKATKTANQGGSLTNSLKGNGVAAKNFISAEQLREHLHYDPDTGVFTHKKSSPRSKIGDVAGNSSHPKGYIQIRANYTRYYAHRLAWLYVYGKWPDAEIDHDNGITSDNRIDNLKVATRLGNMQNLHGCRNKHGSTGVVLHKRSGLYHSTIKVNRKAVSLGYFGTAAEAGAAYAKAKIARDAGVEL